jgi:hypothetical protein
VYRPIEIKALSNYRLWIRFDDGVEGVIDLSHLVGKGIFRLWNDFSAFKKVYIGKHGEIVWSDDLEICPDSTYLKITGKTPEELFPRLCLEEVNA